jgi:hypothetical protein
MALEFCVLIGEPEISLSLPFPYGPPMIKPQCPSPERISITKCSARDSIPIPLSFQPSHYLTTHQTRLRRLNSRPNLTTHSHLPRNYPRSPHPLQHKTHQHHLPQRRHHLRLKPSIPPSRYPLPVLPQYNPPQPLGQPIHLRRFLSPSCFHAPRLTSQSLG